MRRREVDGELADIQKLLNMWGDRETMSATSSSVNRLKALAFRIGCCRAALDTKEGANLHPPTTQGMPPSTAAPVA